MQHHLFFWQGVTKSEEILKATANDRHIEVELEALTPTPHACVGSQTARAVRLEIRMQTEKVLSR